MSHETSPVCVLGHPTREPGEIMSATNPTPRSDRARPRRGACMSHGRSSGAQRAIFIPLSRSLSLSLFYLSHSLSLSLFLMLSSSLCHSLPLSLSLSLCLSLSLSLYLSLSRLFSPICSFFSLNPSPLSYVVLTHTHTHAHTHTHTCMPNHMKAHTCTEVGGSGATFSPLRVSLCLREP